MRDDMPARDLGAQDLNSARGADFEYDEAHDSHDAPVRRAPPPHRADPPSVNIGQGGDYGYDEAHDFATRQGDWWHQRGPRREP